MARKDNGEDHRRGRPETLVDRERGFLPSPDPAARLPADFAVWDAIAEELPKLLAQHRARPALEAMPILDPAPLENGPPLRRAMLVLSYFGHAWVWQGPEVVGAAAGERGGPVARGGAAARPPARPFLRLVRARQLAAARPRGSDRARQRRAAAELPRRHRRGVVHPGARRHRGARRARARRHPSRATRGRRPRPSSG